MWIADAHRDTEAFRGADEKLTAFLEVESATRTLQPLAAALWLGP
jgi:hypothetical protein